MEISELSQTQKRLGRLINGSLLLLVLAAWLAHRYSEYAQAILITTLISATLVSIISLLLTFREGVNASSQEGSNVNDEREDSQEQVAHALSAGDEPYSNVQSDAVQSALQRYVKASLTSNLRRNYQPFLLPFSHHFGMTDVYKYQEARSFIDIAPADPENYTVRVGLVTITVRSGHTDIEVASKQPEASARRSSPDASKVDVLLRPDLDPKVQG